MFCLIRPQKVPATRSKQQKPITSFMKTSPAVALNTPVVPPTLPYPSASPLRLKLNLLLLDLLKRRFQKRLCISAARRDRRVLPAISEPREAKLRGKKMSR
jgi:hypothetical protein